MIFRISFDSISWFTLLWALQQVHSSRGCGGCNNQPSSEAACQRVQTRVISTTGWWGRTAYKKGYYTVLYCCDGYRLDGATCMLISCGGCQNTVSSPQPACAKQMLRTVSERQYYSCGSWWRSATCSRVGYTSRYYIDHVCCGEFTKVGSQCILQVPDIIDPPIVVPPIVCGTRTPTARGQIVGGTDATSGEFPWQVSIRKNVHICGGTIIGNRWILTAAHCVINEVPSNLHVKLGDVRLSVYDTGEVQKRISTIYTHRGYDSNYVTNDIALLETSTAIEFSEYVRPACLPESSSSLYAGTQADITGWGQITTGLRNTSTSARPDVLKKAPVVVKPIADCEMYYGAGLSGILCVRDNSNGRTASACFGDSGGPMTMTSSEGVSTVIGIAAFVHRIGCAMGVPFGYTSVSGYIDWITDIMSTGR